MGGSDIACRPDGLQVLTGTYRSTSDYRHKKDASCIRSGSISNTCAHARDLKMASVLKSDSYTYGRSVCSHSLSKRFSNVQIVFESIRY